MTWKKGESGNPKGGAREKVFADTLRIVLAETDTISGKRKLRRVVENLADAALSGEAWAIQQIADRLDGKPSQDSAVSIVNDTRDLKDWTDEELFAEILRATKAGEPPNPASH